MKGIAIEDVSDEEAAELLRGDRTAVPTMPDARIALAIAAHLESVGDRRPTFAFEMVSATQGLVYVTEDTWPGNGIYRVTVTP